jgi:hypothetical protein
LNGLPGPKSRTLQMLGFASSAFAPPSRARFDANPPFFA